MAVELTTKEIIMLILGIIILAILVILGFKYSDQIKIIFGDLLTSGGNIASG